MLIKKILLLIMAPLTVLALVSFFVKEVFAIIPVIQYQKCYSYFNEHLNEDCGFKLTNEIMFIIINWFDIAGLALLFWKIRNISNELYNKTEVQIVIIFWGIFSVLDYIFLLIRSKLNPSSPTRDTLRILIYAAV